MQTLGSIDIDLDYAYIQHWLKRMHVDFGVN